MSDTVTVTDLAQENTCIDLSVGVRASLRDELIASSEVEQRCKIVSSPRVNARDHIEAVGNFSTDMLKGVRVVGFDVYDTLLFTTGIEHGVAVNGSSDTMVDGVLGALNATMPLQDCSREYAAELVRKFREGEKQHKTVEQTNNNGTIHYEMDAGKIWQDVLSLHDKSEGVRFATIVELERSRYGVLPGVVDFLRALKENDIPIFLISNSQAYTPSILQKACGEFANLLPDDSLCFYSHRSLCSTKPVMKPSPILFNRAFETLEYFVAQNDAVSQHPRTPLQRNEVLFLGNCLRNDGAAMAAGFQFGLVDVFEARTRRDADVVHPSSYFEMGSYAALKREMLD